MSSLIGQSDAFARDYSFAQAANIPKALSEITVATISTIIGVQIPRFGPRMPTS
jgi:hypothetical protein